MDFDYSQPHKIVNGEPVLLTQDEIDARAAEEAIANAARPVQQIKAQLANIDATLNAQRWAREGILGLGDLINLLRSVPSGLTVDGLIAYLQAIPAPGTGMAKLAQVERVTAQALRDQLGALPPA